MRATAMMSLLLGAVLAGVAPATVAAALKHDWRGAEARVRRDLDKLGPRLDALEDASRKEGSVARKELDAKIVGLRAEKGRVEEKLRRLDAATATNRRALSAELEWEERRLEKAVRSLEKKLGRPGKTGEGKPPGS